MNIKRTTTPTVAQPSTPSFDPSTWANQPRLLAANEAESAAIECATYAAGIVLAVALLGAVAWSELGAEPVSVLVFVAVSVVVGALVTLWRWSTTYAEALRNDTDEARRATWQRELDTGQDVDGDGVIGNPFRNIQVRRRDRTEDMAFSHPPSSLRGEPIMDGWGVSQSDLVAMLYEAEMSRGLQERAWVGDSVDKFTLPSGKQVTQTVFRNVLAALAEHDMASKPAGKWQLDVEADAVAQALANLK